MKSFNVGDVSEWSEVGDEFFLPGVPGELHEQRVQLVSDSRVSVYLHDEVGRAGVLVGAGEGALRLRFTARGACRLELEGEGRVFVKRIERKPQLRAESDVPSFATLEPRGVGPSQDLKRMMLMVELNARRREQALRAEIDRLSMAQATFASATSKPEASKPEASGSGASAEAKEPEASPVEG